MNNSNPLHIPPPRGGTDIADDIFQKLGDILKQRRGFSIGCYKDKCIKRRIAIRIRATHSLSAEEYCELLQNDDAELDRLVKVLTIHVSQFFRNWPTYAKLKDEIFPYLFTERAAAGSGLGIWSVGCASGEEPYSIALLLKEYLPSEFARYGARILATDVDTAILDQARQGLFTEDRLTEVPEKILKSWFTNIDGKYRLAPEIMAMVDFEQGDIFAVKSYTKQDLILCRNVLIYFERFQQELILNGFADALGSGGVLVLGKAETLIGNTRNRFQTICPVERIYRVV
jgi:chemotaxis protein methyltransferase CheR